MRQHPAQKDDEGRLRSNVPAPPAMVPSKNLLISITFLTVPEAAEIQRVRRRNDDEPAERRGTGGSRETEGTRTNITSSGGPGINGDDDSTFESESESGGTVVDLDSTSRV